MVSSILIRIFALCASPLQSRKLWHANTCFPPPPLDSTSPKSYNCVKTKYSTFPPKKDKFLVTGIYQGQHGLLPCGPRALASRAAAHKQSPATSQLFVESRLCALLFYLIQMERLDNISRRKMLHILHILHIVHILQFLHIFHKYHILQIWHIRILCIFKYQVLCRPPGGGPRLDGYSFFWGGVHFGGEP